MTTPKQIEYKEITFEDKISYTQMTHDYGRAEFEICPVFKYGRITDLFIVRAQQPAEKEQGYHMNLLKELPSYRINELMIEAQFGLDKPDVWRNWWCKIHRAVCFETYVPNGSTFIKFDAFLGNSFRIQFRGKES
jgi:hypothetical protein